VSDPFDSPEWHGIVANFREKAVGNMADSAFVLSLVPGGDKPGPNFDVKFALETGAAVLLDKPIVAVVTPGSTLPPGLARVAHAVIEADPDTAEGRSHLALEIQRISKTLGLEP